MRLYYCPACARVYYLPKDQKYLCGRKHEASIWPDGRKRRFVIAEKSDTNRPPWPIPAVVEERELFNEDVTETWIDACPHPEDKDYGDMRRHFGYGAPGATHLTTDQVISKYSQFVLSETQA